MPDASQFNIDRTHPGRWTVTFSNPPINMFVPATIVELGALIAELEADPSVKVVVLTTSFNHVAGAVAAEMQEANAFSMRLASILPAAPMATIWVRGARSPHSS